MCTKTMILRNIWGARYWSTESHLCGVAEGYVHNEGDSCFCACGAFYRNAIADFQEGTMNLPHTEVFPVLVQLDSFFKANVFLWNASPVDASELTNCQRNRFQPFTFWKHHSWLDHLILATPSTDRKVCYFTCKADCKLFSDCRFILFVTKCFPLIAKII